MITAENNDDSVTDNTDNNDNMFIINSNIHMNFISDNLCDYFLFDMCFLLNYMNN